MTPISEKSRLASLLLALFVGIFGIHRFYAGKIGTGIVQLLLSLSFFGLFITGFWALIDCIMIAAGTFRDIEGKFIKVW